MADFYLILKGVGVVSLFFSLIFAIVYWIVHFIKKMFPDLKYWIKYSIFRKKYNEKDVEFLMDNLECNVNDDELFKAILLSKTRKCDDIVGYAKEMIYIYKKLKKIVKGGIKK